YLRSWRSISRKPVILPITPDASDFNPPHPEERPPGRVSKDEPHILTSWFETAQARLLTMRAFNLRPDRDFRFGVRVGLQFLQRAAVLPRHPLAEFRQPLFPVRENVGGALRSRQLGVPGDQDVQP